MLVVAMGTSGFIWYQQRLVSNSDNGVYAGHQCSLCYQTKNPNTQLIPIVDLWTDPHCNNNCFGNPLHPCFINGIDFGYQEWTLFRKFQTCYGDFTTLWLHFAPLHDSWSMPSYITVLK